jgi:hypothetical protein
MLSEDKGVARHAEAMMNERALTCRRRPFSRFFSDVMYLAKLTW